MGYRVTQLSSYLFKANEALGYHDHILAETSALPASTDKLLENYKAKVNELKALTKSSKEATSAYTAVKMADKRRVNIYSGCKTYLNAMVKSFDPDISKAALEIMAVFNNFEDIRRVNDNTQTGILDKLIIELDKIDATVHEQAAFTPWFKELKEAHALFLKAVHNKNAVQEIKRRAEVKKAKIECDNAYKSLINRVNAMAEVAEGDETFDPTFIKNVNVYIEGVREAKRAAAKAAKAAKEKKQTSTEDTAKATDPAKDNTEAKAKVNTETKATDSAVSAA